MTAAHAISSIALQRLKVARFSEANDPFELFGLNCYVPNTQRIRDLNQLKKSQNETTGMLCFSRHWTSPVLWSHYADGHKGISLGFDVYVDDVMQVNYTDEKLDFDDTNAATIPEDIRDELHRRKFKHWSYEEEVRWLVPLAAATKEGALHFYPYGDNLRLKEVILGHLCPATLLEPLHSLIDALRIDARVYRARLGFKAFEVKERES
jgi:hypothetical protein